MHIKFDTGTENGDIKYYFSLWSLLASSDSGPLLINGIQLKLCQSHAPKRKKRSRLKEHIEHGEGILNKMWDS